MIRITFVLYCINNILLNERTQPTAHNKPKEERKSQKANSSVANRTSWESKRNGIYQQEEEPSTQTARKTNQETNQPTNQPRNERQGASSVEREESKEEGKKSRVRKEAEYLSKRRRAPS